MKKGDKVNTPRFLTVRIDEMYNSKMEARKEGFIEPTHYENPEFEVLGKHIAINRMIFAGIKK